MTKKNRERIVPGALAALAICTLTEKARRDRRSHMHIHGFRRLHGRGHG
jgi:hypothetical protein